MRRTPTRCAGWWRAAPSCVRSRSAVMEACEKAAYELYDELQAKSAHWKRIYPAWKKFRDDQFLWFRVAESHVRQLRVLLARSARASKPAASTSSARAELVCATARAISGVLLQVAGLSFGSLNCRSRSLSLPPRLEIRPASLRPTCCSGSRRARRSPAACARPTALLVVRCRDRDLDLGRIDLCSVAGCR